MAVESRLTSGRLYKNNEYDYLCREPPKSHEEWLKLLQQQETLHTVEMQKWQRVLKSAVQLLRQVTFMYS